MNSTGQRWIRSTVDHFGSVADMDAFLSTHYAIECLDAKGVQTWFDWFHNIVVLEARNKILDLVFKAGATPGVAWYIGLIDNIGFTGFVPADTMASHSGWTELSAYMGTTRQPFNGGSIAGGTLDNLASKASFVISLNGSIKGAFLTTDGAKGGTTGFLYGEGSLASPRIVTEGDTVIVSVTVSVI